jgi:cytochrome b561
MDRAAAEFSAPAAPRRLPAPELWYALAAIAAVTVLYVVTYQQAGVMPAASGLIGHGIGIVGFVLMLMTATLYSLRKLSNEARWGSVQGWLRFHMVTGLVGPYMVLLHTAMRFTGLAGVAMLLTVVVVASGLVGRYLYAAVPRAVDAAAETGAGGAAGEQELMLDLARRRSSLARRRRAFATWHVLHVPLAWALFAVAFVHILAALYYATLQK